MADASDASDIRRSIPAGATIGAWRARDGWVLRTFDWPAAGARRGSILFQCGRGDFFEKYLEGFAHWHAAGWRITSFDWRGQAGSGRTTERAHVGHIADFALYIDDIRAFWAEWSVAAEGPRVAFGHSMGGHLILRAMVEQAIAPDAAVLVAPMLGLHSPVGPRIGGVLAKLVGNLGDSARPAWKGNERPNTRFSRQQLLTHDLDRYADELWWQARTVDLVTGPPSWNWVIRGLESTRRLRDSAKLRTMATPVLMLVAEADQLVDPQAAVAVAASLPDARVVRFGAEAAHEVLREADPVRDRALSEIDRFLDARAGARA